MLSEETQLHEIVTLQKGVHRWLGISCLAGSAFALEALQTIPGAITKLAEGTPYPFSDFYPLLLLFIAMWIPYEIAENRLTDMERKNFNYAQSHGGSLAVEYEFPERFIGTFNARPIKLRHPKDN